jgi:hypothetical protein
MATQEDIKKAARKTRSVVSVVGTKIKVECQDFDNADDFLELVLRDNPKLPYAVPKKYVFVFDINPAT